MRREMLQTVSRFADVSETVLLLSNSNLSDTDNELHVFSSEFYLPILTKVERHAHFNKGRKACCRFSKTSI